MATMKKPINIEGFFFSDGIIEKYEFDTSQFTMLFTDYCDRKLLFHFYDAIEICVQDDLEDIGVNVSESHLEKDGDRTKLRLLDDDRNEKLTIKFRTYQIEVAE